MLKLSDRKWQEFKISDIFRTVVVNGKLQVPTGSYIHKDVLKQGNIPRITVTSFNNGVDMYWKNEDGNIKIHENFISVSFLGGVFYHKYKASLDMKVHCLQLIGMEYNRNLALFIVQCLKNNTKNSSYGSQLSSTDLPQKKILLPVNAKGKPDYKFMERFVEERESAKRNEYINYVKYTIAEIGSTTGLAENRGGGEGSL